MTTTQTFRMEQISEIIDRLNTDHTKYVGVRDKYSKARSVTGKMIVGSTLVTTVLASSGLAVPRSAGPGVLS